MARLNIALFGAGRIGTYHFKNMLTNEHASISHVVEMDTQRASDLVKKYHMEELIKVLHMDNIDAVLKDPKVDAVMVCTPHDCHEEIVIAALKAGKPVFCEKPLAKTVESVQECYRVAQESNRTLMCGFNRRYDPQHRRIWDSVQSGEMGKVRVVKVTSRDPPSMITREYLEVSGGIFLDACVHDISLSMWLAGEYPSTVYTTGHATDAMFAECGDIDTAAITLTFPSGAIAQIEMSRYAQCSHDQRVEVLGSKSMLRTGDKRPVDVTRYQLDGAHLEPIYDSCDRYIDSYRREVEHFVRVVQGKEKCDVLDSDVMVTTIIAHACKVSLDNQEVINLKKFAKDTFNYDIPYGSKP